MTCGTPASTAPTAATCRSSATRPAFRWRSCDVEPGSTHDLTAARATGFLGALHAAASLPGLPSLADKGYARIGVALVGQGRPSASGHRRPQRADRLPGAERERGIPLLKPRRT